LWQATVYGYMASGGGVAVGIMIYPVGRLGKQNGCGGHRWSS
jgi:hypothetical protein